MAYIIEPSTVEIRNVRTGDKFTVSLRDATQRVESGEWEYVR